MTRILVTGATGTTGQYIFDTLSLRTDVEVKGASRQGHPYGYSQLVHFDYNDRSSIQASLDGIDKVFLVTPFTANMFEMESRVIEEIGRSGVRQVVKLSIAGADAAQPNALAKVHRQLEQALEQTGKSITVL
ncbi:MAG TPA: NAD(P)H-binding protein, partial [Flavisolibacter sp.]|nr:NAD(P)H-binding protein [Flavisolibacter sp.]